MIVREAIACSDAEKHAVVLLFPCLLCQPGDLGHACAVALDLSSFPKLFKGKRVDTRAVLRCCLYRICQLADVTMPVFADALDLSSFPELFKGEPAEARLQRAATLDTCWSLLSKRMEVCWSSGHVEAQGNESSSRHHVKPYPCWLAQHSTPATSPPFKASCDPGQSPRSLPQCTWDFHRIWWGHALIVWATRLTALERVPSHRTWRYHTSFESPDSVGTCCML